MYLETTSENIYLETDTPKLTTELFSALTCRRMYFSADTEHRDDRRLRPVCVPRSRGLRAGRKRPVHRTVRFERKEYERGAFIRAE